jgi:hypothetical protein
MVQDVMETANSMEHAEMQHETKRAETEHAGTEHVSNPPYATELTLLYDPPYESELDDVLARHLVAYLVPAASLTYRARLGTGYSSCRFDFLIDLGTRRIAIDYTDTPHNPEAALVEDNDALALGSGNVDVVVRVRRQDLEERLFDCLHLVGKWEPCLFTPYGRRVFARRASEAARCALPEPEADLATIHYRGEAAGATCTTIEDVLSGDLFEWPEPDDRARTLVIRRMSRERPGIWRHQYQRAALVYGRAPVCRH